LNCFKQTAPSTPLPLGKQVVNNFSPSQGVSYQTASDECMGFYTKAVVRELVNLNKQIG
jgi:hypothetical protein